MENHRGWGGCGGGGMGGGTGTGFVKVLPIKIRHYVKLFRRLLNMKKNFPHGFIFVFIPYFTVAILS